MMRFNAQGLRRGRTEEGKARRRMYADNSGMLKFSDKYAYPGDDGCSSCVTTFINKDNLIVEYEEC